MYLNKYPSFYQPEKEIVKCGKIFRPWDSADKSAKLTSYLEKRDKVLDNCAQDATISTTTENEDNETKFSNEAKMEICKIAAQAKPSKISSEDVKKIQAKVEQFKEERLLNYGPNKCLEENISTLPPFVNYPAEGYSMYPDFVQLNLAHSLGLTPSDPLFLECVNQGCTLEEYTRVLSQEHQAKILSSRKQRPKKHRCPHCDVGFSNNGQLKGHIRIHTGERPFRCEENNCGKTFTRNEELTRHKRIHSGLRPFPCTHCGKRFGRKDHLKKHSRTHFQPRGLYAVPVMLPYETWTSQAAYPYVPMFTY